MFCLVLLLLSSHVFSSFQSSQYQHSQIMIPNIYSLHWTIDKDMINLALEVTTTGWVGFGIAEQTSGTMGGSDIVQGFVTPDGSIEFEDRYALRQLPGTNTFNPPLKDTCQDWNLIGGEEIDGKTILELSRKIVTSDVQDRPFLLSGNTKIILAWGADSEDVLTSYHTKQRRKATFVDFSGQTYVNPLQSLIDNPSVLTFDFLGTFDVTTNRTKVDQQNANFPQGIPRDHLDWIDDVTIYANYYMNLSHLLIDGDIQIVGVEHIINNHTKEIVHHFVMSGFYFDEQGNLLDGVGIYGWAPGVEPLVLNKCGFSSSGNKYNTLALNTHYDNVHHLDGVIDHSGVRVYYTRNFLPNDCGYTGAGQGDKVDGEDPWLPGGISKYVYECTPKFPAGVNEVTVIKEFLHMHTVGREQWSEIYQNGTWIKTTAIDFWDFNFQSEQVPQIGEYKIHSGDKLRCTCIFETAGPKKTKFGLASQDEMCLCSQMFYPDAYLGDCGYLGPGKGGDIRTETVDANFETSFGAHPLVCPLEQEPTPSSASLITIQWMFLAFFFSAILLSGDNI